MHNNEKGHRRPSSITGCSDPNFQLYLDNYGDKPYVLSAISTQ